MVLKKVTGVKVSVDLQVRDRADVDAPSIVVYSPARAFFKSLALRLVGVTALTEPNQIAAVQGAAATLLDAYDTDWTAADALKILNAVGTQPAPSHVRVDRLQGQSTLLFRAALPKAPGARPLNYPTGVARPAISLLAALRPEGISIPNGMCMDVPVKLVEDEEGLALAAYFRQSNLRKAMEEQETSNAEDTTPSTEDA
ncbi:MAG TPA: hypothetical protein VGK74_10275 [Symbiobacteriaceae bacterium]